MPQALAISPLSRARRALTASFISDLRSLTIEESDEVLRICGTVESFYHKQLAQELVLTEIDDDDLEIVNAIVVG